MSKQENEMCPWINCTKTDYRRGSPTAHHPLTMPTPPCTDIIARKTVETKL